MQNNINNNDQDAFSEIFRQKLENYELPVAESNWDAIQAGLKARKRKKIFPVWWLTAGAAAVFLLFVGLNFYRQPALEESMAKNNEEMELPQQTNTMADAGKQKTENARFDNVNENAIITAIDETKSKQSKVRVLSKKSNQEAIDSRVAVVAENALVDNILENEVVVAVNEQPAKEILKSDTKRDQLGLTNELETVAEWNDPLTKQTSKQWTLMASVASSESSNAGPQLSDANGGGTRMGIVRSPLLSESNATILAPSDFAAKTFHAPLSFGLTAARELNNFFSLETGLIYTYLFTDFDASNYTADLNLHYLGIPVNVLGKILDKQKWTVYASTGVMLEKGLRSIYIQEQQFGNQIITTTASTKITGVQWSLNAAAGLTYAIYSDIDLYLEPKFSYYFDNDQPISVRTERRFALGVEAGLRFKL